MAYRRDFAVDQQNGVPRQMEIFRPFQIQSVKLDVASEKTTGDKRRKGDPLATAREQRVIARIKHNAGKNLALESRARLRLDEVRCAARHIKNIDVLQRISQSAVRVSIERFPHLDHESVIALVIFVAQIICFGVKKLTGKREASIEEVRFGQGHNKILPLGAVLDTQAEFLASSGEGRPVEKIEITLGEFGKPDQLVNRTEATAEA